MTLHMIRDWKYLAISTKILGKQKLDTYLEKIIDKFKDTRIQTETLNDASLFSFRIGRKERVICKPSKHQDQDCLVIVEILENHQYDRLYKNNHHDFKIVAASQEFLTNNKDIPEPCYTLPRVSSTNLFNKTLILSSDQLKILENINSDAKIFKINGAAGSGKTLIAELLLCNAFIENNEPNLLYITKSGKLVSEINKHIDNLLGDEATRRNKHLVLKTYDDFCKDLGFNNPRSDLKHFTPWVQAQKIFMTYTKDMKKQKLRNNTIAKEIYEDIRKLHDNNENEHIGKKQSYNHSISYKVLPLYQKYLQRNKLIDLALISVNGNDIAFPSYNYIVVDETQDFGLSELNLIFSCLRQAIGNIYCFMDTNQSLIDDFNITPDHIRTLAISKKMKLSEYNLAYNYRNPPLISTLASHIMKIKNIMLGGVINKGSDTGIQTTNGDSLLSRDDMYGCITWINTNTEDNTKAFDDNGQKVLDKLNQESKNSLELAIIIPDNTFLSRAKTLFPDGLIFTPQEIKGLEFKKVVLFNFISGEYSNNSITYQDIRDINECIHKKEKKNFPKTTQVAQTGAKYSQFFNNLFVAITRTTHSLYFIETKERKSQEFNKLISFYESTVGDRVLEDIDLKQASLSDLLMQFENISKQELSSNMLEQYSNKIYDRIQHADLNTEAKTDFINKLEEILKNTQVLQNTTTQLTTTLENIPVKNVTMVNNENISTSTTTRSSSSQSCQVKTTKKIDSKSIAAENNSITDVHDVFTKDISLFIKQRQLECICNDINKSTILCVITCTPNTQNKLLGYINDKGHKALIRATSNKALNYYNKINRSALYNLLANKNLNPLFNILITDKDFVKKISIEGLSRVGPNGYAPIHLISEQTETLKNHIEALCKESATLKTLQDIQNIRKDIPPLHAAADDENIEVMKLLINQGAQVDAKDNSGNTPLHYAANKGNIQAIEFLVQEGADVNAKDNNSGNTSLHAAVDNGNIEVIKLLINQGAQVDAKDNAGNTSLHYAANKGNIQAIEFLVQKEADVNAKDNKGNTPLYYAARNGKIQAIEFLVQNGADVKAHNSKDYTPLHYAASKGNVQAIEFLVQNGADVNAHNSKDHTPLHAAAGNGNVQAIEFLVQNGADVNGKDNNAGNTPLHYAASKGNVQAIEFLVQNGADVNGKDNNAGNTPLHYAASKGNVQAIEFLVQNGADVNAKDDKGYTPLYYAMECRHLETTKFLVQEGADVNAKDNKGNTPLYYAEHYKHSISIKFFINQVTQVGAKGNQGNTSLYYAKHNINTKGMKVNCNKYTTSSCSK